MRLEDATTEKTTRTERAEDELWAEDEPWVENQSWAKKNEDKLLKIAGVSIVGIWLFLVWRYRPDPDRRDEWDRLPPKPTEASDSVDVDADMNVDMMLSAPDVPGYDALGSPIELADTTITIPTAQGEFATGLEGIGGFTGIGGDGGLVEVDNGGLVDGLFEAAADLLF